MNSMTFSKFHATGNDFLVRLDMDGARDISAAEAAWLCDRHMGIGADGLITVGKASGDSGADCSFRLQNADGRDAEMSGNGMRALAALAAGRGAMGNESTLVVETRIGIRMVTLQRASGGLVVAANVDMGAAQFEPSDVPVAVDDPCGISATIHGVRYSGDAIGMGNPHWVVFVDDVAAARVTQHGRWLETDERFPNSTNVEFVRIIDRNHIEMRVWERGVGETMSCGTGACAAASVAHRRGLVDTNVTVQVPGGELAVEIGDTVLLGGPVVHVFDVTVDLNNTLNNTCNDALTTSSRLGAEHEQYEQEMQ